MESWVGEQLTTLSKVFGGIVEALSPISPKAVTGVDLESPGRKVGSGERVVAQAAATLGALGGGFEGDRAAARLTSGQAKDLARYLGYTKEARGTGIKSMGQKVFSNGRNYITQDITMHQGVSATWKMFDMDINRLGTFDALLNIRLGK